MFSLATTVWVYIYVPLLYLVLPTGRCQLRATTTKPRKVLDAKKHKNGRAVFFPPVDGIQGQNKLSSLHHVDASIHLGHCDQTAAKKLRQPLHAVVGKLQTGMPGKVTLQVEVPGGGQQVAQSPPCY